MHSRLGIHQMPIPTPFRVGDVNVYLLEGDVLTLVDCGPNTEAARQALHDELATRGYRLQDIEQLIVTHHHTDHIGLASYVIEQSGAKLLAHEYTAPFLTNPDPTRHRYDTFFNQVCKDGNVPDDMLEIIVKVTTWIDQFTNDPVPVDQILHEGDKVFAGSNQWQVLHTPGHAGDLICLWDAESATLLASDHLILKISSNPLVEPSPIEGEDQTRPRRLIEYLYHMERVAALHPQKAYSGHGEPILTVEELVKTRVDFHHRRAEKILGYFDEGPAHLWGVTERMYAHIPKEQQFLAISEVLGHIDLLENDGRLQRIVQDGIVYWQQNRA